MGRDMKQFEESIESVRFSRRKISTGLTCLFDNNPAAFAVWDISNQGFSFLSGVDAFFKEGAVFNKISILNGEKLEVINAEGVVVSTTEFGDEQRRVGIKYLKKKMDRTVGGKVRIQRHFPKIPMEASLIIKHPEPERKIEGTVLDYTASTARIGFTEKLSGHKFQIGDELEIIVMMKDKIILKSLAYILRIKDDHTGIIINFVDEYLDLEQIDTLSKSLSNREKIISALGSLKEFEGLSNDYKALICDWRLYFSSLKNMLDHEEKIHNLKEASEMALFLQGIENEVMSDQKQFIDKLNDIAVNVPEKESLEYKKYFRKNLIPYIKTSPLAASIIDRDNGYPGDFETIKQFFVNPYSGDSLFSRLMNKFIYSTDAVQAHQRRIQYLYDQIQSIYDGTEEEFSMLLFGSGPAEEVLRFVERNELQKPVYATLVDMDAFALADFSERLQYLQRDNFHVELININILDLLRNKNMNFVRDKYTLTYSAGLFDYFKDTFCKRFIRSFHEYTRPGGSIIITNVHKNNSTRYLMDYGAGWEVIHREEKEMLALVPQNLPVTLSYDENQANIFLKITVPD